MDRSRIIPLAASLALAFCMLALAHGSAWAQPSFFEDVTAQFGMDTINYAGDATWYDWEGDGDLDMLVSTRFGGGTYIYQNDGDHFTPLGNIGLPEGIDGGRPIPMDFNQDGTLDLFFLCYSNPSPMYVNENGHFVERTAALGLPQVTNDRENKWIDVDHDGWMDLLLGNEYTGFKLFHNDEGLHFSDITAGSHLPSLSEFMQIAESDYDLDGDIDLFMTRLNADDHLFQNDGNGVFTDVTQAAGLGGAVGNGGCRWADFDHDKYPDMLTEGPGRHAIWHGNGDGTFSELTVHGTETDWYGGGFPNTAYYAVADFDMDGDADIYVCRPGGCGGGDAPNQFLIQDSLIGNDIYFHDVAPAWGLDFPEDGAPGVGDFDGDGDLDLYITRNEAPYKLLRNTTNLASHLEVRVLGPAGELDRWHSRVEVYAHGTTDLVASSELNTGNVGRNGNNNYFVLSDNGHYDLKVYFASGTVMTPETDPELSDVVPAELNYKLTVYQSHLATPASGGVASSFQLEPAYPNPFNGRTTLRYQVPAAGPATLTVYNIAGQRVATLFTGSAAAGEHSLSWNAAGQASGVYIVELRAGATVAQQKVMLLK